MKDDRFMQGYACALACIQSAHDEPVAVSEAMGAGGIGSVKALKAANIDKHDFEILLPLAQRLDERKRLEPR